MLASVAAIGWPVLDRIRFGDSFAHLAARPLHRDRLHDRGVAARAGSVPRGAISAEEVNAIAFWSLIGAIIGSRLFYVIAHYLRVRQHRPDARDLARRHLAAGRHRGRHPHQRSAGAAATATGSSRWPTRWLRAWPWGSPSDGSAISSSAITWASPRRGSWPGSTRAARSRRRSRASNDAVPGGAPGRPSARRSIAPVRSCWTPGHMIARRASGVHQTALYDMILAAVLFALLWFVQKRSRGARASSPSRSASGTGCERILEDSLRIDKRFWSGSPGSSGRRRRGDHLRRDLLIWWALPSRTPGRAPSPTTRRAVGPRAARRAARPDVERSGRSRA